MFPLSCGYSLLVFNHLKTVLVMYFYLTRMKVFSLINVTVDWIDTKKVYILILSLFSQVRQV